MITLNSKILDVKCDIVTFTELKDLSTSATNEMRNILITSEHKVILDVNSCVNISNIKLCVEFNNRLRLYFRDTGTSHIEDKFKLILLNYLLMMIIIITDVLGSILMF